MLISKTTAETRVREESGRLAVEAPADSHADLDVRRDEVMHAGAEEMMTEVVLFVR